MRQHWSNCITHFDEQVDPFLQEYFGDASRKCVLVAAAGFDPRSLIVATKLAAVMGDRLQALFIREERTQPEAGLVTLAEGNEAQLRALVPNSTVERIEIFAQDGAAVGGQRVSQLLRGIVLADEITDIVLDMSALSIGIGFPAAVLLLNLCEQTASRAFHLMIVSNPELDERIASEPADRPLVVRGFAGNVEESELPKARIWLPQLTRGRSAALERIGAQIDEQYKCCPILPFPSRNPRRADDLITEYQAQLAQWNVDPRDLVYVSEHNPLDCYRTLSTLKQRYDATVEDVFDPHIILSPVGSKVLAAGAMMAAIEHNLGIQYLETLRYDVDQADMAPRPPDLVTHILLSGPCYADYATSSDPAAVAPADSGDAGQAES